MLGPADGGSLSDDDEGRVLRTYVDGSLDGISA